MTPLQATLRIILIGLGATVFMDLSLMLLKRSGVPTLNFAFIGRWAGHLARGQLFHPAIARAAPIHGELALGWTLHYAIGIAFAGALVGLGGLAWVDQPSPGLAIAVGVVTFLVPLLVMQPAMGAGLASSRTPTPIRNCLRSLANHAVFGVGLYLAAYCLALYGR